MTAEPMFLPLMMNWTFATATLSEAVAVKVTSEPDTVAPSEGVVKETDGGVVSAVMLGLMVVEILSGTLPGVTDLGAASRMPVGVTETATWMVELPRFPFTAPSTVMENESWP